MSGSSIPPVSTPPSSPPSGTGQVVQIVTLPEGLQNNARAIRLQGEVVRQNNDGTMRIKTPEGDIDIQVRGRQPQPGQRIEIDIPPGSPPERANVRPAPAQAPQPQQPAPPQTPPSSTTPAPAQTTPPVQTPSAPPATTPPAQGQPAPPPATGGTAQPLPTQPVPAPSGQPVPATATQDIYTPAKPAEGQAQRPSLPPLTPGQMVKLVPQTPLPAVAMVETPEGTMTPKHQMQTTMIAQKSEGNLIATLLQAVKSVLPQSVITQTTLPQNATPKFPMPASAQAPQLPLPPNTAQMPLVLSAKIISLVLPSGQTLAAPPVTAMPQPAILPTPAAVSNAPAQITSSITPSAIVPITVMVTEITPQQQPVIQIPLGDAKGSVQNFILQSPPASVPVGTQVTLQPQPPQIPLQTQTTPAVPLATGTPMPSMPATPVPGLQLAPPVSMLPPAWRGLLPPLAPSTLWPVMDELFQTFYQATPQAAQILGRTIPSPSNGANFGPAVLLFAAALKSGDLQAWMGERKLEMLQKLGKESLLSRLSGETSSLSSNNDAGATDWKSFPIPLLWQNEISKVMFHVRKEPSEDGRENEDGATRFVMDLSLTRMGDVQIDGLVRGKQLDLIVRTQMPISAPMQDAMRVAYARALDGTDIFGDIGFQSDIAQWTHVLKREDALAAV